MTIFPPGWMFLARSAFRIGAVSFAVEIETKVGACLERDCGIREGVRQAGKRSAVLATGFCPAGTNASALRTSPFPSRTKLCSRRKRALQRGGNLVWAGQRFLQRGQSSLRAGHSFVRGGQRLLRTGPAFVPAGVASLRAGQGFLRPAQSSVFSEKGNFAGSKALFRASQPLSLNPKTKPTSHATHTGHLGRHGFPRQSFALGHAGPDLGWPRP